QQSGSAGDEAAGGCVEGTGDAVEGVHARGAALLEFFDGVGVHARFFGEVFLGEAVAHAVFADAVSDMLHECGPAFPGVWLFPGSAGPRVVWPGLMMAYPSASRVGTPPGRGFVGGRVFPVKTPPEGGCDNRSAFRLATYSTGGVVVRGPPPPFSFLPLCLLLPRPTGADSRSAHRGTGRPNLAPPTARHGLSPR